MCTKNQNIVKCTHKKHIYCKKKKNMKLSIYSTFLNVKYCIGIYYVFEIFTFFVHIDDSQL